MHKVVTVAFIATMLSALSFTAVANTAAGPIDIQSTPAEIRMAQEGIRKAIERKEGAYKDLSTAERQAILDHQQVVLRGLEGKDSIAMLNEPQKVEIANALESINALVASAEDSRKVCERIKVIGSNRPQSVCMTVGERRRQREAVQREGLKTTH